MTSPDAVVPVDLTARNWSVIDATLDNTAQNAIDALDDATEEIASAIRDAGRVQVPWVDGEWPPMDRMITVALTNAQWRFALAELASSAARRYDDKSFELCSDAADTVRPQLPG